MTATSLGVSWTPLQAGQWNGSPKGYLVRYRPSNRTRRQVVASDEGEDEEVDERNSAWVGTSFKGTVCRVN